MLSLSEVQHLILSVSVDQARHLTLIAVFADNNLANRFDNPVQHAYQQNDALLVHSVVLLDLLLVEYEVLQFARVLTDLLLLRRRRGGAEGFLVFGGQVLEEPRVRI
jgi:hypothetical protein